MSETFKFELTESVFKTAKTCFLEGVLLVSFRSIFPKSFVAKSFANSTLVSTLKVTGTAPPL